MSGAKVHELFRAAIEIDSTGERAAFVSENADTPEIRDRVTTLLNHHLACPTEESDSAHLHLRAAVESAWEGGAARGSLPSAIGPFRILGHLGAGGMAAVFRARQERPRRDIALKMLHPGDWDATAVARFEQEAEVLGRLQHEGIAQIYDSGLVQTTDGERAYLTMELVDGGDVLAYANENALDVEQRIDLVLQILDAASYAHQSGVIHRDLKPSNVLVTARGRCKLLDFGIARLIDDESRHTTTGNVLGTLRYMSPEQVGGGGGGVRIRTDVYAIGVMAYELLSGRHPLDDVPGRGAELVSSILTRDPPALRDIAPGLPRDLSTVVHKAVERDPERRYATADAFAADLRRYLKGEPVEARDPTLSYQLRKFVGRNRALVGGLGVAVLGLIAAVVLSLSYAQQAEEDRRRADKYAADVVRSASLLRLRTASQNIRDARYLAALRELDAVPEGQRTWAWDLLYARCDTRVDWTDPISSRTAVVVAPGGALSLRRLDAQDERFMREPVWSPRELAEFVVLRHGGDAEERIFATPVLDQQPARWARGRCLYRGAEGLFYADGWPGTPGSKRLGRLEAKVRVSVFAQHAEEARVIVGTATGGIVIWDPDTGALEETAVEVEETVTAVAWSPRGDQVAVAGQAGLLGVYDLASGRRVDSLGGARGVIDFLAFANDGRQLVARSRVRSGQRLGRHGACRFHAWALGASAALDVLAPDEAENNYVYGVDVSPDGERIAVASWPRRVRVLDRRSLRVLHRFDCQRAPNTVVDVLLSAEGRRATCRLTGGIIEVHDLENEAPPRTLRTASLAMRFSRGLDNDEVLWLDQNTGRACSLRMSGPPSASDDRRAGRRPEAWETHRNPIACDRRGRIVVTGVVRGTTRGWTSMDWPSGEIRREHVDAVHAAEETTALTLWRGSGEVVRGTGGGRIIVDSLDGGTLRLSLAAHVGTVYAVAMHPAGRILASGGKDGVIRLWDFATGEELVALTDHADYVHDLAFTPDGTTLISGSGDGTARVWSSEPFRDRYRAAHAGR